MTDITTLTDEEKSVMLAKLVGWEEVETNDFSTCFWIDDERGYFYVWETGEGLYSSDNMPLAWRILNWAHNNFVTVDRMAIHDMFWVTQIYGSKPEDAQRLWLDRVLEIAIKGGVVE